MSNVSSMMGMLDRNKAVVLLMGNGAVKAKALVQSKSRVLRERPLPGKALVAAMLLPLLMDKVTMHSFTAINPHLFLRLIVNQEMEILAALVLGFLFPNKKRVPLKVVENNEHFFILTPHQKII